VRCAALEAQKYISFILNAEVANTFDKDFLVLLISRRGQRETRVAAWLGSQEGMCYNASQTPSCSCFARKYVPTLPFSVCPIASAAAIVQGSITCWEGDALQLSLERGGAREHGYRNNPQSMQGWSSDIYFPRDEGSSVKAATSKLAD
jgi:hypothetical protein